MARAGYAPIDRVLTGIHEAASTPHRMTLAKQALLSALDQLPPAHKAFFEEKLAEMEAAAGSKRVLDRIQNEIDEWTSKNYPIGRL